MMNSSSDFQPELSFKIVTHFPDVCVHKGQAANLGLSGRVIPAFVSDWLVCRYSKIDEYGQTIVDIQSIHEFIKKYLPDKKQRQTIIFALRNGEKIKILDSFSVTVNIKTGELQLKIPSLDLFGTVLESIVDDNNLLLLGNVWGSGTLRWRAVEGKKDAYEIIMVDFKPMQAINIDLNFYLEKRSFFTTDEWLALLTRTMGYAEHKYSIRQKLLMLTRLIPLVEPKTNIIELAPKGTGKSFIYSQLSRHSWLVSGGVVTRAQLFYDMQKKCAGIISNYSTVILDEIQTIRLSNEGEIVGALKGYLESGEYRVMGFHGTSDAGFVLLGNISIENGIPKERNYFVELPTWLRGHGATALLDRFHALVPGWELPRIETSSLCNNYALRADYFGEILYALRGSQEHTSYVQQHTSSTGDLRDARAVQRIACGYLKLIFPNIQQVLPEDFQKYCLEPAFELRQSMKQQMSVMDPEFLPYITPITLR